MVGLMSPVRLWEWTVDPGAENSPVGVSGTCHGAMEALSLTLVTARKAASGRVVPLRLADGESGFSYVRMAPVLTADCERGVIRWS